MYHFKHLICSISFVVVLCIIFIHYGLVHLLLRLFQYEQRKKQVLSTICRIVMLIGVSLEGLRMKGFLVISLR